MHSATAGDNFRDETIAIRAGLPAGTQGEPFLPGPTFAAPYHLMGPDIASAPYIYNRQGNPTWSAFENALGELEHGHAVVFSSGMAAILSTLMSRLMPGDVVLVPSDSYSLVRIVIENELVPRGVVLRTHSTSGADFRQAVEGAQLVWLESLSNPGLDVCDMGDIIDFAHECGAFIVVDNSFVTPFGQRPLDLGADLTVASASKYITGHSDLMLGYVAAQDGADAEAFRKRRALNGAVPGPFEAWLAHRSLATLALRLERQCHNALVVSQFLSDRSDVAHVRYPGRSEDPVHARAARHLSSFGSVLHFQLDTGTMAQQFLAHCRLVHEATSFGGVHTTAECTKRWGHDDVPEGFVRMSVGCEHADDLVSDISRALDLVG